MPDACLAPTLGPAPTPYSRCRLTFAGKTAEHSAPRNHCPPDTGLILHRSSPAHLCVHDPLPAAWQNRTQPHRPVSTSSPGPPHLVLPAHAYTPVHTHPGSTRTRQLARTHVHTPAHLCPRTRSPNRNVAPLSLLLTLHRGLIPGML